MERDMKKGGEMELLQAFKFELRPGGEQKRSLSKFAGCKRFVYNKALACRVAAYEDGIAIEDLKVKNMSGSAKGTLNQPGKNIAAKSGLNKSILDQGWGMFRTMLEYKMERRGHMLIAVPPMNTSRHVSLVDTKATPTRWRPSTSKRRVTPC